MPPTAAPSKPDQRVDLVCSHLMYEIATGVFACEDKLPTVREAAQRWRVDHRVVLKAYRRLEALGLVRRVPRSGYYVAIGESHELISRHRFALEAMFDRIAGEIAGTTNLSVLGAFRYLAQLAETRARRNPECVFVECTQLQAAGHAQEVTERLAIPCSPMTTAQISGGSNSVPAHVRTMLVTGFHLAEIRGRRLPKELTIHSAPIEVSPSLGKAVARRGRTIVFESDEAQAEQMAEDLSRLQGARQPRLEITADINAALEDLFGARRVRQKPTAFLSPRLWGQADPKWRDHADVKLIRFQIVESAWPGIADAIGLPLGAIGGFGG